MSELREITTILLMVSGALFLTIGSIGIVRFPGFFSRLHAASLGDTFGTSLFALGMIVHNGLSLDSLKIIAVFVIIAITGPVGTHALARAALKSGMKPWISPERRKKEFK